MGFKVKRLVKKVAAPFVDTAKAVVGVAGDVVGAGVGAVAGAFGLTPDEPSGPSGPSAEEIAAAKKAEEDALAKKANDEATAKKAAEDKEKGEKLELRQDKLLQQAQAVGAIRSGNEADVLQYSLAPTRKRNVSRKLLG